MVIVVISPSCKIPYIFMGLSPDIDGIEWGFFRDSMEDNGTVSYNLLMGLKTLVPRFGTPQLAGEFIRKYKRVIIPKEYHIICDNIM